MSVALERRLTKDQILELYLNDVWLGQRGSFAIHGVAEAARLFFGKDITNVSLSEAATIAGVIQSPPRHSPFNNPERAKERRNVVLKAMAEAGSSAPRPRSAPRSEPLQVAARALENEAPYFVDYVSQELQDKYSAVAGAVDVYTTLDLHLQRIAQDAVRDGLDARRRAARASASGSRRRRRWSPSIRAPARSSRWSAAAPTTSRSTTARSARSASPARSSSRSSTSRRSSTRTRKGAPTSRRRRSSIDEPTTFDVQRADVDAGQLRRRIRRPDHAAPRARAVAQHRDDQGRRDDRLRRGRRALAAGRRRHAAARLSVDRARRVRGHAARDRDRLHAVSQRRHRSARCAPSRAS